MIVTRSSHPNLILYGGSITTFHPELPHCQALACRDGVILALGDDQEILALAGPETECIDLAGCSVVPGFHDAHNHMLQFGLKLTQIQLDACQSIAEMAELVRQAALNTPAGEWIIGDGWNESLFAEARLPNRHDLDAATTTHPVVLKRFFNMFVVNSLALERAGITPETPDPQGGKIEREADGAPNGILRAAAKRFVYEVMPAPTQEQQVAAIERAGRAYLAVGITSILEPGLVPEEIRAYQLARRAGRLPLRANLMPSWHGFIEGEDPADLEARAAALGVFSGFGDDWLRLGGLKMAVDGGTTSRTAWMFQPFVGETKVHNYNRLDPEDLREFFGRGHTLGWDIGIHAIGDRAHHEAAAAFADVLGQQLRQDHRHNLIHAYFASEPSLVQMAQHQIAAVIQPTFIYFEGDDLFRDVGAELAHRYKPMRTFLDRGIPVIATSDVPSTPHYNPMVGLYSLITRKTWKGTLIAPQEAVSREEALFAYTVAGSWLTREEQRKGRLTPGMLADLAVLDRDFFTCDVEEIRDIQVDLTVVGGEIVYRRVGEGRA